MNGGTAQARGDHPSCLATQSLATSWNHLIVSRIQLNTIMYLDVAEVQILVMIDEHHVQCLQAKPDQTHIHTNRKY